MAAAKWESILEQNLQRKMEHGQKKYGVFDPQKDKRNLVDDILDELYDAINYTRMGVSAGQIPAGFAGLLEDQIKSSAFSLIILKMSKNEEK